MEDMLVRVPWLVVMAIIAYIAVGCGSPAPQPVATAQEETPERASTTETAPVPTVLAATQVTADRGSVASLVIEPQPAPQSGQVRVSGKGFAAGESISVSAARTTDANSDRVPLANAVASSEGSLDPLTLTLPDSLQSGGHAVEAVSQGSGRTANATLWIHAPQPWLVLDSYDVPQYGDFGFVAGGFEPLDQVLAWLEAAAGANESPIQLEALTTDQAGNSPWSQIKLPQLAAGTYTMVLHGQANGAELRRDVHVTPLKPTLELSPWAGPAGSTLQVNVRGFAPNERVHASIGGAQDATPLQADAFGNLWGAGPLRIPQTAAPGGLTLSLVGGDSGATSTAEFKVLDPKPWLELTSWSGAPGAPVSFAGGGWIGGEQVSIHIGSAATPALLSAMADDAGWLKNAGLVYIPNEVDDDVIFVAVGDKSHLVAAATFKVVFPFGLRPGRPETPRVTSGG
jgi:hypothetical protein